MPFDFGQNPNRINALELVVGSFEDMESAFYEVKRGEHHWREVLPEASIDTSVNPGASEKSYRVRDWTGQGSFRSRHDQGVPTVGQTIDKILIPIETAGVAARFDRDDARAVQMGYNENLVTELPKYMRKAAENHVEGTVFYGDSSVGFDGWLDYTGVTSSVATNGAASSPLWANKTPAEILRDINDAITSVWTASKLRHLPNRVYLSPERLAFISSRQVNENANGDVSILKYIKQNNIYTQQTGTELEVMPIRYLDNAGAGSTHRMVVADMESDNLVMPFPIPFDMLEPQPNGFDVDLFAEYKFGSFHYRYPGSVIYVDGI